MSRYGSRSRVVTGTAALCLAALVPLSQAAGSRPAIKVHLSAATAGAPARAGDARGAAAGLTGAGLDWPEYLHTPQHDSVSSTTAFTVSNAASAAMVTTTIGGTTYAGSIGQVDPATGTYIWHTGLPCAVEGTPTLDDAMVLAVGTYACPKTDNPGAYLISASTGKILESLPVSSGKVFGQPVFAQGTLFVATATNGLYDFAP